MAPPKNTAASTTYGDHEVIVPENKLRKVVSSRPLEPGEEDPVARAEKALADLSGEFASWMDSECERLDKARHLVSVAGFTSANKEALFHAAHDIKGEAATFGFSAMASAADSLCRLIELTPEARCVPLVLVDQHVDAVRAIVREHDLPHAENMAADLTEKLRHVTEEFLRSVTAEGPDMASPPTAPAK